MEKWVKVAVLLLALIFVAGIVIWSCMYFIIYYPLLHRTWTKANCTITEVRDFTITYMTVTELSVYTAIVESNNTVVGEGYGCSSSANEAVLNVEIVGGTYPYEYMDCSDIYLVPSDSCKEDELLQPNWMCFDQSDKYGFQVGNRVECKYYVNGNENADTYTYPQAGENFIEVLYHEEVFIPMADYIALWLCVFGLMCVLPWVLCFLGLPIPLGWYTAAERQKYRDFYRRFLCCRRKQLPRCIEDCGDIYAKVPPASIIVWLYTVKTQAQHFPLKVALIREVADYIV